MAFMGTDRTVFFKRVFVLPGTGLWAADNAGHGYGGRRLLPLAQKYEAGVLSDGRTGHDGHEQPLRSNMQSGVFPRTQNRKSSFARMHSL